MGGGRNGGGSGCSRRSTGAAVALALVATARPCDACVKERARWFCGADGVFLCEQCDGNVHNSNCVARRHHRQRLDALGQPFPPTPPKRSTPTTTSSSALPPHKRPRTSWGKPHSNLACLRSCLLPPKLEPQPLPPNRQHRHNFHLPLSIKLEPPDHPLKFANLDFYDAPLHQVPTFFPFEHLLSHTPSPDDPPSVRDAFPSFSSSTPVSPLPSSPLCSSGADELSSDEVIGFVVRHDDSCDVVDSFLGDRFYEIERDMRSIMGEAVDAIAPSSVVSANCYELVVPKTETDQGENLSGSYLSTGIISTDTTTTATTVLEGATSDGEYQIDVTDFEPDREEITDADCDEKSSGGHRLFLTLNYDDILSAWSDRGSPWADGSWERKVAEDCNLDLAAWELDRAAPNAEGAQDEGAQVIMMVDDGQSDGTNGGDGGGSSSGGSAREARVMRYREKRRTRLFSKKIRYEVRKLNAERRPRMKGRFIKRTLD